MLTLILTTKDVEKAEKFSDINLSINEGIKVEMKNGRSFKFSAFSDRETVLDRICKFQTKAQLRASRLEESLKEARLNSSPVEQEYLEKIQADPLYIRYPPASQTVNEKLKRQVLI